MSKLVLVKYRFKRHEQSYIQSIIFVLEPGMQLHERLDAERERALRLLIKSRGFWPQEVFFASIEHIQVEDNEVMDAEKASPPELRELQDILAALELLSVQLDAANGPERRKALYKAKVTLLQRLAEFGKPAG